MIIDRFENWQKHFSGSGWSVAFEALAALTAQSPVGETKLRGDDIVLKVMSYATVGPDKANLESHRTFIDIQAALDGAEGFEWHPIDGLKVTEEYVPERDVMHFERPGPGPARLDVHPGTFVVFFPEDGHLAKQMVGGESRTIKKAVVKLRASLVNKQG